MLKVLRTEHHEYEDAARMSDPDGDNFDDGYEHNDDNKKDEEASSGRFIFRSLVELPPPPERVEIVDGLIGAGEIVLLTGPQGSGKSTLAASLAASVSKGLPWLGRQALAGTVLYIANERPKGVRRNLRAAEANEGEVLILEAPMTLPDDAEALGQEIESLSWAYDVRLIIVDTLASAIPGLDENSAPSMGRVAEALRRIIRGVPGAAIVVVHHVGKGAVKSSRGSTALPAAADLELRVDGSRGVRTASVVKANDVPDGQTFNFRIEPIERDGQTYHRAVGVGAEADPAKIARFSSANTERKAAARERDAQLRALLPRDGSAPDLDALRVLARAQGLLDDVQPVRHTELTILKRMLRRLTS